MKDLIDRGVFEIKYIPTELQVADMLTKDLGTLKLQKLLALVGPQEGCEIAKCDGYCGQPHGHA